MCPCFRVKRLAGSIAHGHRTGFQRHGKGILNIFGGGIVLRYLSSKEDSHAATDELPELGGTSADVKEVNNLNSISIEHEATRFHPNLMPLVLRKPNEMVWQRAGHAKQKFGISVRETCFRRGEL